jgi:hypothetical protein
VETRSEIERIPELYDLLDEKYRKKLCNWVFRSYLDRIRLTAHTAKHIISFFFSFLFFLCRLEYSVTEKIVCLCVGSGRRLHSTPASSILSLFADKGRWDYTYTLLLHSLGSRTEFLHSLTAALHLFPLNFSFPNQFSFKSVSILDLMIRCAEHLARSVAVLHANCYVLI